MELYLIILCIVFFLTAFMYSSVGHGGASGYLAIMALSEIAPESMKPSALILNLAVSLVAFIYFSRSGHFKWKLFYPFAITSVPFAYIGSSIGVDPFWYKKILALCLGIACIRIFGFLKVKETLQEKTIPMIPALTAGAIIGLLSGMIGIGGGILLSPLILILGWGKLKETACVSALFIFVNSFSGLLPIASKINEVTIYFPFLLSAIAGGFIGGWFGSSKAKPLTLKIALGFVLLVASIKLIII